jgi:O-antigen/teichoic acid export membrane protein
MTSAGPGSPARPRHPKLGLSIDGQDQVKRGLLWLGSATLAARVLDLTATVVIVSLLTKEQMGLAALPISACAILESLSGIGIGSALVQADDLSAKEESSLFWLTSAVGVGLGLILLGLAPLLAMTYDEAELSPLVAASSLKLALVGVGVVPQQLLSKRLEFRELGTVQTLASLGEGIVKIALALAGAGAWSLVIGNVARGFVLLVALWVLSSFRPQLHFAFEETKRFVRFGLQVAGSGVLYQLYKNADYFLVGKLLNIEALGLYRVAFDVAMQPTDAIIAVVGRVGFPVYSRLSHDHVALRTTFASNTRSLFLMVAPLAAFIVIATQQLFEVVGEGRWLGAVPAVRILVWAGLLRAATTMFPQVYVALGKPVYATLDSLLTLVILSASFWLGLTWFPEAGVLSVCYAWLLIYPLFLAGHLLVIRRLIGLEQGRYWRALGAGFGPVLPMALGLFGVEQLTRGRGLGLLVLPLLALVGLAIYWAYLRWVLSVRFADLLPKRSRGATAPPS